MEQNPGRIFFVVLYDTSEILQRASRGCHNISRDKRKFLHLIVTGTESLNTFMEFRGMDS